MAEIKIKDLEDLIVYKDKFMSSERAKEDNWLSLYFSSIDKLKLDFRVKDTLDKIIECVVSLKERTKSVRLKKAIEMINLLLKKEIKVVEEGLI